MNKSSIPPGEKPENQGENQSEKSAHHQGGGGEVGCGGEGASKEGEKMSRMWKQGFVYS